MPLTEITMTILKSTMTLTEITMTLTEFTMKPAAPKLLLPRGAQGGLSQGSGDAASDPRIGRRRAAAAESPVKFQCH